MDAGSLSGSATTKPNDMKVEITNYKENWHTYTAIAIDGNVIELTDSIPCAVGDKRKVWLSKGQLKKIKRAVWRNLPMSAKIVDTNRLRISIH